MALRCLDSRSNVKGLKVEVTEKGHKVVGTIEYYEKEAGLLGLLVNKKLEKIHRSDVEHLEILGKGEGRKFPIETAKFADEEEMLKIFRDLKPQRRQFQLGGRRDRDRSHLKHLHNLQIDKLLCKNPPPGGTEEMNTYQDEDGHSYLHLPSVDQTPEPRLDDNGRQWTGGFTEKIIREKTWRRKDQCPVIDTPSRLYIIDTIETDLFHQAVNVLDTSSSIGFSSEGEMLGREGRLSWLVFSTERDVFMFDIIKIGGNAFIFGLKAILENQKVRKIVHNSQQICDCLFHQWDVKMENIMDTMAADLVFCSEYVFGKQIPKYFRSLPRLLVDYLGIATSHIFFPRYRRTQLASDSSVWVTRPAADHLVLGAARNCLYLLPLYNQIRRGNMLKFHLANRSLSSSLRDKSDPEAARVNLKFVPKEFSQIFHCRKNNIARRNKLQGNFVHQSISNTDPLCIFSKDSMHQTQVIQ